MMTARLAILLLSVLTLSPPAHAGVEAGGGVSGGVDDPFLNQRGVGGFASWASNEWVALGVQAAFYPDLGDLDWTNLTKQLVEENHVSPDISKMKATGMGIADITPVRTRVGTSETTIGFRAGLGLTQTQDDLDALNKDPDDPQAAATAVQLQVSMLYGIHGTAYPGAGTIGVRIGIERITWVETVNSTTLEMKSPTLFGVTLVVRTPVADAEGGR